MCVWYLHFHVLVIIVYLSCVYSSLPAASVCVCVCVGGGFVYQKRPMFYNLHKSELKTDTFDNIILANILEFESSRCTARELWRNV